MAERPRSRPARAQGGCGDARVPAARREPQSSERTAAATGSTAPRCGASTPRCTPAPESLRARAELAGRSARSTAGSGERGPCRRGWRRSCTGASSAVCDAMLPCRSRPGRRLAQPWGRRAVARMSTSMITMPRKLAVVPSYNEAASVGDVVRKLRTNAPDYDVVVVDDGSTDATARIAGDAGACVLRLPFNLGIGGAVQAGFKYAMDNGYDYAIQVDGDGQHDPGGDRQARGDDARARRGHGLRLALPHRGPRVPRAGQPPHGHPRLRVPALADRRAAGERSHLRLQADQPPRHLRVRPRLSARLSRGRGRADGALAPAADVRGTRADVHPPRGRVVDRRIREVGVLHGEGPPRDLRGTVPPPPHRRAGRGRRGDRAQGI